MVNGRACLYVGDINKDDVIDGSDLSIVDNAAFNYTSGYNVADVTGDNYVDASDISIVDNNAFNSVGKITPPGATLRPFQSFSNKTFLRKLGEVPWDRSEVEKS